ncbi:MAG: ABC transporter permease [Campylobacterota bacterium]|nr:ABC transporter permease [Campylobacterota bacterium]
MELIPIQNIFFMLFPLAVVGYFYHRWVDDSKEIIYATLRMVIQLILIGYVLIYIFENDSWYIGLFIILFMIGMSSFIVLRNIEEKNLSLYFVVFFAIAVGGSINLILVIEFVLDLTPFYEPRYVVPIAGMIYANCMNAVSLAAERYEKELINSSHKEAQKIAFKSSMIPRINTFLAVGIVSLPGMMTGQILSGVDPLVAIRYQIVVMAMILGSSGISVIVYLKMIQRLKNRA